MGVAVWERKMDKGYGNSPVRRLAERGVFNGLSGKTDG